nr:hypothetical protein [Sedimentibacter sp.]
MKKREVWIFPSIMRKHIDKIFIEITHLMCDFSNLFLQVDNNDMDSIIEIKT